MRELKKADKEDVIVDNLFHKGVDRVTSLAAIGTLISNCLDWTAEQIHKLFCKLAKLFTEGDTGLEKYGPEFKKHIDKGVWNATAESRAFIATAIKACPAAFDNYNEIVKKSIEKTKEKKNRFIQLKKKKEQGTLTTDEKDILDLLSDIFESVQENLEASRKEFTKAI